MTTEQDALDLNLTGESVYTIIAEESLSAASTGGHVSSPIREGRRWVRGRELLVEAQAAGQRLPIIFADARKTSRLLGWAVLEDVQVDGAGTTFRFSRLSRITSHTRRDLRRASTGKPFGEGFIRPYAICRTPSFLVKGTGSASGARNPPWKRDELILALDLYFDPRPTSISQTHPAVVALSKVLNDLPIHGERPDAVRFRNPNGVYMKLCNFLRYDPTYKGKGLQRGAKAEEDVWNKFAGDRALLKRTADAIRAAAKSPGVAASAASEVNEEEEFPEGKVLYRMHRSRERSAELRERAKAAALRKTGCLRCAACGFDFSEKYGEIGRGYIECHHTIPVAELKVDRGKTKLKDVALLCANCHRMVHRRRPWLSLKELGALLANGAGRSGETAA